MNLNTIEEKENLNWYIKYLNPSHNILLNINLKDKKQVLENFFKLTNITPWEAFNINKNKKKETNLNNISKEKNKYLITIKKKNLLPTFMFITELNNQSKSIIITENKDIYAINVSFSSNNYNNTLFEGFLVQNDISLFYYIDDIIYFQNKVPVVNLINRINLICSIIKNKIKNNNKHYIILHTGYFTYEHIPLIKKDCILLIKSIKENQTYYINYKIEKKYNYFNGQIKKFKISKTDIIDVYTINDIKTNKKQGILSVIGLDTSKKMFNIFKIKKHSILKCKYSSYFKSWIPLV